MIDKVLLAPLVLVQGLEIKLFETHRRFQLLASEVVPNQEIFQDAFSLVSLSVVHRIGSNLILTDSPDAADSIALMNVSLAAILIEL